MAQTALDRITRLLNGKANHPFDFINNPIFFDPRPEMDTEYFKNLNAIAVVSYVTANEANEEVPFTFRASAMSNGDLAYDYVDRNPDPIIRATAKSGTPGYKTTQNLTKHYAEVEVLDNIIYPNQLADYAAAERVGAGFPDAGVAVPIGYEAALRMQRVNPALSNGASFQDWTFERWWIPRVVDSSHAVASGSHTYSRNAAPEELTETFIQCGFFDDVREHIGAGKEYDLTDENGKVISLTDRAWDRAKHIVDVTERGFITNFAVAALIAEFQVDDWLNTLGASGNPLDKDKLHPVLAKRTDAEKARMKRLKAMMLPYLAEKGLTELPYEEDKDLKVYVEREILPLKGQPVNVKSLKSKLFAYQPIGGYEHPNHDVPETKKAFAKASSGRFSDRPQKRRQPDGRYFERSARLFDDGLYDQLDLRERAILPVIMGAAESVQLPNHAPRAAFFLCDAKGGARAQRFMKKHGAESIRYLQSQKRYTGKNSFVNAVIRLNEQDRSGRIEQIRGLDVWGEEGVGNIMTTANVQNIVKAVEKNPEVCATQGSPALSAKSKLALMTEMLDRNIDVLVAQDGWAAHHDEVYLMARGVMVATGLVDRPRGTEKYEMDFYKETKDPELGTTTVKSMDFYDILTDMAAVTEPMLDANAKAVEHYVAMARMLHLLDAYIDPRLMNHDHERDLNTGAVKTRETIHWQNAPYLMQFWHTDSEKREEIKELRERIRDKILTVGIHHFDRENDLNGLDEEYDAAWRVAQGLDDQESRRTYNGTNIHLSRNRLRR